MLPGPKTVHAPPTAEWLALKDAVQRFEQVWRQGPRPSIEDFLPAGDPLRARVLVELVHIDLELRLKAGEAARVEEYLARYPKLTDDRAVAIELIVAEYELRRRCELRLALDEYLRRFPQYRSELAEQITWPTVAAGDRAQGLAGRRTEAPPDVAGFEVLGLLGRGGMGGVYEARQQSRQRPVAPKVLPEECSRDPGWRVRVLPDAY